MENFALNTLRIIKHNVRHWNSTKNSVITSYSEFNPHIVLINSYGLKDKERLKIPGYQVYKINNTNDIHDGSAIAVKQTLQHKFDNDFDTDFLAIEVHTTLGKIKIVTTYLPPHRAFLPFTDIHKLLSNNIPTFIISDLNAQHQSRSHGPLGSKFPYFS